MMFNSSEEMIKRINQRMNFLLNQVKKKHRILFTLSCKPLQATDENYNFEAGMKKQEEKKLFVLDKLQCLY